jgi:hypothetical protein
MLRDLPGLLVAYGITGEALMADLRSGKLVGEMEGVGPPTREAFKQAVSNGAVWFTGSALIRWLALREMEQ